MLSPLDDYPVHQTPDVMRHVATSDRRFYDRYYFNLHSSAPDLFMVMGYGQYPNLGVADAYAAILVDGEQRVVRASRELGNDRMDLSVGPFSIRVVEGLRALELSLAAAELGMDFELAWDAAVLPVLEPRHVVHEHGRVVFDVTRLGQTGRWSGRIRTGERTFEVSPDRWWGFRDRSWGVRRGVGEPEPKGIERSRPRESFFWIDAAMQFDDHSLLVVMQEDAAGHRRLEHAVRAWSDPSRPVESLGRPEYELEFHPGTREVAGGEISFSGDGASDHVVRFETSAPLNLGAGTGYGGGDKDDTWLHGSYQGPLKVEGLTYPMRTADDRARHRFGVVDNLARYECDGAVGWGLFEFAAFGPHVPTGFKGWRDVAS